jgi:hypothetical protein
MYKWSKFVIQSWWIFGCSRQGLPNNIEYHCPAILKIVVVIGNSRFEIWVGKSLRIPLGYIHHYVAIFIWKGEVYLPCAPNFIYREFMIMFTLYTPSTNVLVTLYLTSSIVIIGIWASIVVAWNISSFFQLTF